MMRINVGRAFQPLLQPARYKGARGGRGSGKSHFFAEQLVKDSIAIPGLRSLCGREVQKSLKQSAKQLIENKINKFGLGEADGFRIYNDVIRTPGDGIIIFEGLKDHTADSIKSYEGFKRVWIEEAHTVGAKSLRLLRPTIRDDDAEMFFSWNPRSRKDPVDYLFRGPTPPTGAICIVSNWRDNPWLPNALNQERKDCKRDDPEQYAHIWEGEYITIMKGAYYARQLAEARRDNRIVKVARDPLMALRAYWDIGSTGNDADYVSIGIVQFVDKEIRFVDHYTAQGQELGYHLNWLRSNGYEAATCILPHDGRQHERVYKITYESAIREAGFSVRSIPNQGAGAALKRVEAARRVFPKIWFNEPKTTALIEALGWYHEKFDEERDIGLGPEHDWSSHDADMFGLMAIDYEAPEKNPVADEWEKFRPRGVYA